MCVNGIVLLQSMAHYWSDDVLVCFVAAVGAHTWKVFKSIYGGGPMLKSNSERIDEATPVIVKEQPIAPVE
jgi:hypothetical protein